MVIVGGEFRFSPEQRDEFLAGHVDAIRKTRAEAGCLEYSFGADPTDPGRVVLFERWADQASLDAHLAGMRNDPPPAEPGVFPTSATITVYDVTGERPLG